MATPRTLIKALTAVEKPTQSSTNSLSGSDKKSTESPKTLIKEVLQNEQITTTPRLQENWRKQERRTEAEGISPFKNITPESDPRNQRFSIATPTSNVDASSVSRKTLSRNTPLNRTSIASIKTPNSLGGNFPETPDAEVASPSTPPTQLFAIATPIQPSKGKEVATPRNSSINKATNNTIVANSPLSPSNNISQENEFILTNSPIQDSPSPSSPTRNSPLQKKEIKTPSSSKAPATSPFHLSQSPDSNSPKDSNTPSVPKPVERSEHNIHQKEKYKQTTLHSFLSNRLFLPDSYLSEVSQDQDFDISKHRKQLQLLKPKTIEFSGISLPFAPTSMQNKPLKGILKKTKKVGGNTNRIE